MKSQPLHFIDCQQELLHPTRLELQRKVTVLHGLLIASAVVALLGWVTVGIVCVLR